MIKKIIIIKGEEKRIEERSGRSKEGGKKGEKKKKEEERKGKLSLSHKYTSYTTAKTLQMAKNDQKVEKIKSHIITDLGY